VLGSLLRSLLGTALVVLVALAVGYRPTADPARWLAALGLVALLLYAIAWVAAGIGLATGNATGAASLAAIFQILPFLSGAFVPTETMPGWLQAFTANQPMTHIVATLRGLLNATPVGNHGWFAVSLVRRRHRRRVPLGTGGLRPASPPVSSQPLSRYASRSASVDGVFDGGGNVGEQLLSAPQRTANPFDFQLPRGDLPGGLADLLGAGQGAGMAGEHAAKRRGRALLGLDVVATQTDQTPGAVFPGRQGAQVGTHVPHRAAGAKRGPLLNGRCTQRLVAVDVCVDAAHRLPVRLDERGGVELGVHHHGVQCGVSGQRGDALD
jgi:hypothetical protein